MRNGLYIKWSRPFMRRNKSNRSHRVESNLYGVGYKGPLDQVHKANSTFRTFSLFVYVPTNYPVVMVYRGLVMGMAFLARSNHASLTCTSAISPTNSYRSRLTKSIIHRFDFIGSRYKARRINITRRATSFRFFSSSRHTLYSYGLRATSVPTQSTFRKDGICSLSRINLRVLYSRYNSFFLNMFRLPAMRILNLRVMIIRCLIRSILIHHVTREEQITSGPFFNFLFLNRIEAYQPCTHDILKYNVTCTSWVERLFIFPTVKRFLNRSSTTFVRAYIASFFFVRRSLSSNNFRYLCSYFITNANSTLVALTIIINTGVRCNIIFTIMPSGRFSIALIR